VAIDSDKPEPSDEVEHESASERPPGLDFAISAARGPIRVCAAGATNFRSFREVTFRPGDLTAVVGANAAGKSSVIDVFRFISDSLRLSLYTAIERRGGIRAVRHISPTRPRNCRIWIELEFANDYRARYSFRIRSEAGGSYSVPEEECRVTRFDETIARIALKGGRVVDQHSSFAFYPEFTEHSPGLDPTALGLPIYGAIPDISPVLSALRDMRLYNIIPDKLRELQDPDEGLELLPDGSNAASVLRNLDPADRAELIAMLEYVVPGVLDVDDVSHGNKLTLQFTQQASAGRNKFEALQMSDGTLRLLGLLLALYQRDTPGFMAIEEPEATIHIAALNALVEVFRSRSDRTQIVLTTHSADILDAVDVDSIYLVTSEGGHSILSPVSDESKAAVHSALFTPGELLRSGGLQPQVTE
jgi:predicted ATPase